MLHVSRLTPDADRMAEFVAGLWQGALPDDLVLHRWIYLEGATRQMLLIWEGGDAAAASEEATNGTGGLAACFARDLEGFGQWMRDNRGASGEALAAELELRERGLHADSFADAVQLGREWRSAHPG
jgi:hypothetical protein